MRFIFDNFNDDGYSAMVSDKGYFDITKGEAAHGYPLSWYEPNPMPGLKKEDKPFTVYDGDVSELGIEYGHKMNGWIMSDIFFSYEDSFHSDKSIGSSDGDNDRLAEIIKQWWIKNKESIIAKENDYEKEWHKKNKENMKELIQTHPHMKDWAEKQLEAYNE